MERSNGSACIATIFCLFLILFQLSDLVVCSSADDDTLENALEFVERRQRDLQESEYYGQPENIGYGYQRNFGFFQNGPVRELGSADSMSENDNEFRSPYNGYYDRDNDYDGGYGKRRSSYGVEYVGPDGLVSDGRGPITDSQRAYMQVLRDMWSKYRDSRPDDVNLEDMSSEDVTELLNGMYDKDGESDEGSSMGYSGPYGTIPVRVRRNYRVFDRLNSRRKRYPSFGEGFYGKRNVHPQHIGYQNPSENEFLYSLKFVNPKSNREGVENLRDRGYDVLGDERDGDVMDILNDAATDGGRTEMEEPYWVKTEEPYEREIWLSAPVSYPPEDGYEEGSGFVGDKRMSPKIFKPHNGVHINTKRMPVKRSSRREKKEATDEKVSKELENIFGTRTEDLSSTTVAPQKKDAVTKKAVEVAKKQKEAPVKKQNVTKPEVTKHRDAKKLVRRANDYTKEAVYPSSENDKELDEIFSVKKVADKKSIDWSEYFGYDKRSEPWLRGDSRNRAESHFLFPLSKRYYLQDPATGNWIDISRYEAPFDTRVFNNKKKFAIIMDKNIDRMEKKLGTIEEKIIDDAVKYTGAHTGEERDDPRKVKNEIVHHLEAAYSLEKMKNALEEFKNSMKTEKTFSGATDEQKKAGTESPKTEDHATTARVESAKTEKSQTEKKKKDSSRKEIEDVYGKDSSEFMNWPKAKDNSYDGFRRAENQEEGCPIVDKGLANCMKNDDVNGRYSALLLPICTLQQICYVCGSEIGLTKISSCDMIYLRQAEALCQGNRGCVLSARNSVLQTRDLHEQDLLMGPPSHVPGSCLYNPCIQKYLSDFPLAAAPIDYHNRA